MDMKPFLEINLLDIKEPLIEQLKKYTKHSLNLDELHDDATQLKYTKEIAQIANKEFAQPSEDFVRFFAQQVYPKKITQKTLENFTLITKESLTHFLSDKINERLKMAASISPVDATNKSQETAKNEPPGSTSDEDEEGIITTAEEWEGYYYIKAILNGVIDPSKVVMKDTKSYCGG
jgi:hypothetical protein